MQHLLWLLLVSFPLLICAQTDRIILDEDFTDWANVPLGNMDPTGDQGSSNIDFEGLWVSNDDDYIFFRIQVGDEINIQSNNDITLYLDTDNNANTGLSINGIGANLIYRLGEREGNVYVGNTPINVGHDDIQLVSSPTVSSDEFEIGINRKLNFFNQDIFSGNTVRVLFVNEVFNGDQVPDATGGLSYTYDTQNPDPLPAFSFDKPAEAQVRVLSYNVLFDGLFESNKQPSFSRIFKVIEPDIIGFQEIYDHSSSQVVNVVSSFLPGQWYHAKVNPDIVAVSRYPIIGSYVIPGTGNGANGAFLIDIDPLQMLMIVAHTPCCDNDFNRQLEIDAIMAFVRNAKAGIGPLTLTPNSPIVVLGDMNLVGFEQQQSTLITGDIVNQNTYGDDFNPDWDETAFEDTKPITTKLPFTYTWFFEGSSFSPGRLDYIIYSGSVMDLHNSFALFTPAFTQTELINYNLGFNDVPTASDHLPIVADFDLGIALSEQSPVEDPANSLVVAPNPTQGDAMVHYFLDRPSKVLIRLFDLSGRELMVLKNEPQPAGANAVLLPTDSLSTGAYLCHLQTERGKVLREMVVVY